MGTLDQRRMLVKTDSLWGVDTEESGNELHGSLSPGEKSPGQSKCTIVLYGYSTGGF
jgi:hypothetical protein